jgi:transcriptional regulator with XRE-family HTH domain
MSPGTPATDAVEAVTLAVSGIRHTVGDVIRNERRRRHWTLAELATRSRVAVSTLHGVEAGKGGSLEMVVRIARALALEVRVDIDDPRQRPGLRQTTDIVHAAMGELEIAHLRGHRLPVGVDEPYQHYQFAGRADVIAWDMERHALLHIENRTRFPDIQAVAGSFNAKRDHLADSIAKRLGLRTFESQTHVIVALWSAEVLHSIRLRPETFRALCPDPPDAFDSWWRGDAPRSGATSSLVLLDLFATGRQRRTLSLDQALGPSRPRVRGYSEAARRLGGGL